MKHSNLLTAALTALLGLAMVSFSLAQDSTQVRRHRHMRDGSHSGQPVEDHQRLHQQIQHPSDMQHGAGFVDENGDGYNDNAPDHDDDGIPNGMDPDYSRPQAGAGRGGCGFVDENGDGINDNRGSAGGKRGGCSRGGYGPGTGAGNGGVGPADGSGYGAKTGIFDGTGPKGKTGKASKN